MKINQLKYLCLFLLFAALSKQAAAQITFQQTVTIENPTAISIDRKSNLYITDQKSNLYQLDPFCRPLNTFSAPVTGRASIIDAWSMFKILVFYDDNQKISFFDRFLRELTTIRLNEYFDGMIRAATLSGDDKLWLFNESDFSLIKFDHRFNEKIVETPLINILNNNQFDIRFIREYQNNVYLVDKNAGIYVFDNMGNYKKKLPFTGVSFTGFLDEEMYFLKDNKVYFFNLYTFKEREIEIPLQKPYINVLASENHIYLLLENGIDIYQY